MEPEHKHAIFLQWEVAAFSKGLKHMLTCSDFEPFEVSFISPDPQATAAVLVISHHLIIAIWGYHKCDKMSLMHRKV